MRDDTMITSWRRFSDTFKGLVNPGRGAGVQNMPPAPAQQEKDGPQLATWEDEGGKISGRPST
jgi:hypothetical protein